MRRYSFAPTLILAVLATATLTAAPVLAQGQQKPQILPLKPPPPPPIKPYTPVAAKPPVAYDDAAFVAFRKQLSDVAAKKDRAALAKLVVAQGFFWIQDKDMRRSEKARHRQSRQGDRSCRQGRLRLGHSRRLRQRADRGRIARPQGRVLRAGRSDHRSAGLRSARQGDADRSVRMGLSAQGRRRSSCRGATEFSGRRKAGFEPGARAARFGPPNDPNPPAFLHVATPSGKSGFIAMDAIAPLGGDQMCYSKDSSGWKITGYLGGASQ